MNESALINLTVTTQYHYYLHPVLCHNGFFFPNKTSTNIGFILVSATCFDPCLDHHQALS
jgi:hypothetical protein